MPFGECQTFIQAIRNYLGHEPGGARLDTKAFPHKSGTYYEGICYYDPALPEAEDYAPAANARPQPPGKKAVSSRRRA